MEPHYADMALCWWHQQRLNLELEEMESEQDDDLDSLDVAPAVGSRVLLAMLNHPRCNPPAVLPGVDVIERSRRPLERGASRLLTVALLAVARERSHPLAKRGTRKRRSRLNNGIDPVTGCAMGALRAIRIT